MLASKHFTKKIGKPLDRVKPISGGTNDLKKSKSPDCESGFAAIEFLAALILFLSTSVFIFWGTWILAIKVHLENVASHAATLIAHDALLAHHQGREPRIGFVKKWAKSTINEFPFIRLFGIEGLNTRLKFFQNSPVNADVHVSIHLCSPSHSSLMKNQSPAFTSETHRDCLGQWSNHWSSPNSWMRVDNRHLAHSSHRIYQDGLNNAPDETAREEIIKRILTTRGQNETR